MSVTYRVTHRTEYRYESEVVPSYSQLHLVPRELPGQYLVSSAVTIDPEPEYFRERIDYFGNRVAYAAIQAPHRRLTVTADSVVRIADRPSGPSLLGERPWEQVRNEAQTSHNGDRLEAAQFVLDSPLVHGSGEFAAYALRSFTPGRPLLQAVTELCSRIHADFRYKPGATTVNTPVAEVFAKRAGVCQDFAHLGIACLRAIGLPARYVSGYLETDPPPGRPEAQGRRRVPRLAVGAARGGRLAPARPDERSARQRALHRHRPWTGLLRRAAAEGRHPHAGQDAASEGDGGRGGARGLATRYTDVVRSFACDNCGQLVFFENSLCLRCSTPLALVPSRLDVVALTGGPSTAALRPCANSTLAECNWAVEEDEAGPLCRSCVLTRTRPPDTDPEGLSAFAKAETAKRRLLFELFDLGLPVEEGRLRFDLLSSSAGPVVTGHDDGLITIDLGESNDARREQRRAELGEPYRTLLGHFRHEIGHYYEPILVDRAGERDAFRELFGDERADYDAALERHYAEGPPPDWPQRHVSAYAAMHPWEDWAETFAHYLHIRDTLQTAAAFGLLVAGPADAPDPALMAIPPADPGARPFADMIDEWLPLTYALNAVNRSMGRGDLYPFTLPATVIDKLTFVHDRVLDAVAVR